MIRTKRGIARREPFAVSVAASCALPFSRYLCPGRTLSAVDSSGTPK